MTAPSNSWNRFRYTLWAPGYNILAGYFRRKRRRSFELLGLSAGERVLLVGAGTGLDLDFVPPEVAVTAVDLTPAMLERLRRRARDLGRSVDARIMDAQALELPDASFDAVVLHLIVAVVSDPSRCLAEAARVLRPGGRAAILDKFVSDRGRPPLILRVVDPLARFLATSVTRKLGPLIEGSGLRIVHEEAAGLGGLFKIAIVRKP